MLGLGKGRISILSQLHEQGHFAIIFGHCLSSNSKDYGFMFIGEDFDYPRCLTWLLTEVIYGNHEQSLLGRNQPFVLDSGATYTHFLDPLYQQLLTKIAEMPLQKVPGDDVYPDCWEDTRPFTSISDLRNLFSSLYLKSGNGQGLEIPPENYLIIMEDGDVCLAILNGFAHGMNNFNLIGAISMQNVMVVYDNEQQQIGWAPVIGCTQPLNCPP
ncbi:aspartyl protease APCB1-like [Dendrobium catenatum]|uniref:aspartyl protease APCB1-like n=1 Tax=Dendrobium catenatum TaxID=906689 RepID=UPI0010A01628|nr:aspartyl protease APCB1-like [Dendrobium catenatum]